VGDIVLNRSSLDRAPAADEQWSAQVLAECPVVTVAISSLLPADSPRQSGEISSHVQNLIEVGESLPPIIIHGPSSRIIDGMHRTRAALARGQTEIRAIVYSGSIRDAFAIAVRSNTSHGLPLSRPERLAAAKRIIASHPEWSDRRIAGIAGIAVGTVGKIRIRSNEARQQLDSRVGQDGRVRPLNGAAGRELVVKLLLEHPTATLREIATEAGVSPATAHDVRHRMQTGQDPVPQRKRTHLEHESGVDHRQPSKQGDVTAGAEAVRAELASLLTQMRKDPSLRFSETGRGLLKWLDFHVSSMADWDQIEKSIPTHCIPIVAKIAHSYAKAWEGFAKRIKQG
jgi:ParB-like chromosome segregation protein Spo0J